MTSTDAAANSRSSDESGPRQWDRIRKRPKDYRQANLLDYEEAVRSNCTIRIGPGKPAMMPASTAWPSFTVSALSASDLISRNNSRRLRAEMMMKLERMTETLE